MKKQYPHLHNFAKKAIASMLLFLLVFVQTTVAQGYNVNVGVIDYGASTGSLAGQSVVLNGAAGYTIPMSGAPGTGGVMPELALSYSSTGTSGVLGVGWGITGLSSISRTGQSQYYDGQNTTIKWDGNDKLSLNGERLIALSGTYMQAGSTYGTENENFTRITAVGGFADNPDHFKMETKEGILFEFGKDFQSKHSSPFFQGFIWHVSKMTYPDGNYVEYKYKSSHTINGSTFYQPVIDEIHYTGNAIAGLLPHAVIKFNYIDKFDHTTHQNIFFNLNNKLTLSSVEYSTEGQFVKRYEFSYSFSKTTTFLVGVKEVGVNAYLGSTKFQYGDAAANLESELFTMATTEDLFIGNVNGDGVPDKVFGGKASPTSEFNTYIKFPHLANNVTLPGLTKLVGLGDSNGDGIDEAATVIREFVSDGNILFPQLLDVTRLRLYHNINPNGSLPYQDITDYDSPPFTPTTPSTHLEKIYPADYNADGLTDYLMIQPGLGVMVAYGQRDQSNPLTAWSAVTVNVGSFTPLAQWYADVERLHLGDFNGDGRADLLLINGAVSAIYSFTQGPNQLNEIFYQNGAPLGINQSLFDQKHFLWLGDFNGDGHTDVLNRTGKNGIWKILLGGLDFSSNLTFNVVTPNFQGTFNFEDEDNFGNYKGDIIVVGDFNADGKSDVAHMGSHTSNSSFVDVYYDGTLNNTVLTSEILNLPFIKSTSNVEFIDYDGQHRILYTPGTTQSPRTLGVFVKSQELLLKAIGTNEGHVTSFDYKLMSEKIDINDNFYTRGAISTASNALTNVQNTAWLVKEYKVSNGQGGTKKQNYRYANATYHRLGKGLLGFLKTTTEDEASYLVNETNMVPNATLGIMIPGTQSTKFITSPTPFLSSLTNYSIGNLPLGRYIMLAASVSVQNTEENRLTTTVYNGYDNFGNPNGTTTTVAQGNANQVVETKTIAFSNYHSAGSSTPNKPQTIISTNTRAGDVPYSVTTQYTYNAKVQVTQKIDYDNRPERITTNFTYQPHGGLATTSRSAVNVPTQVSAQEYDSKGRYVTSSTDALGTTTYTATYDPRWGVPLTSTDVRGLTTSYTYDGWGRLLTATSPEGVATTKNYTWLAGQAKKQETVTTSGAPTSISTTDMIGRGIESAVQGFNGNYIKATTSYDALSRVAETTEPAYSSESGVNASMQYGLANTTQRLASTTTNFGQSNHSYIYSQGVEQMTTTTPDGKTNKAFIDASGKQVKTADNTNEELLFTHSSSGGVLTVTQAGVQLMSMTYDYAGRKLSQTDISQGTTSYTYDAYGRLLSETNPRGQTTTMTYDVLDRVLTTSRLEGTTIYEYFANNQGVKKYKLKKIIGHSGEITEYDYDGFGRTISEQITIAGVLHTTTFTYDASSRPSTTTYPSGLTLTYEYDAYGNLISTKNGAQNYYTILNENGRGQTTSMSTGDGKTRNYTYQNNLLNRIRTTDNAFDLQMNWDLITQNLFYRIDQYGNRDDFTYDNLDRLKSYRRISSAGTRRDTLNYSSRGNITYKTDIGNYTYDATKIYSVQSVENTSGLLPAEEQQIQYNSFEQPIFIQQGANRIEFTYGYDGQRLTATKLLNGVITEVRTYLGGYEKLVSGGQTRYLHYIATDVGLVTIVESVGSTHTPHYIYTDHLGSILRATSIGGTIEFEQNFDAWGRHRSATTWEYIASPTLPVWLNRGYTGHEMLPEVGLIHMNARLYDPALARMLSPDQLVPNPSYTQSYNRYSYAFNNPLKYVDPDGNEPITAMLIGSAIGLVTNGIRNMSSGKSFFEGAGKAALYGAISGVFSFGIGQATAGISNKVLQAASQAVAHGYVGGMMSEMQGGKFVHGLIAGGTSSAISSGAAALGFGPTMMIATGGLSGGISSKVSGGSFWSGVRQGLISSGLNHAMHMGGDGGGDPEKPIMAKSPKLLAMESMIASGFSPNLEGAGMASLGLAFESSKIIMHNEKTWFSLYKMKTYNNSFNGNGFTGGRLKHGKFMSNAFDKFGKGLGLINGVKITDDFRSQKTNGTTFVGEFTSNLYSTFGGMNGAIWGLGWEGGRIFSQTKWYHENLYLRFNPGGRDGLLSTYK